jgi:hypothetical protein
MTIYYSFDPVTKELLGQHAAQVDPLETAHRGKAIYCGIPSNATTVKPPKITTDQTAIWNGTAWAIVPDFRGQTWWRGEKAETVNALGDPTSLGLSQDRVIDVTPGRIKGECRIRIRAAINDAAQANLAANAAAGLLSKEQMQTYRAGLAWVSAMRARCADLVKVGEPAFRDDRLWPTCPDAVLTLAKEF